MPSTTENEENIEDNLFKMPASMQPPENEKQWVSATEFSGVQSSIEWDSLLMRGSGIPPSKDFTRDSLFAKFDPLTRKRESVVCPPPTKQVKAPEENPMIGAINLVKQKIEGKKKEYELAKGQREQNLVDMEHIKLETKAAKDDLNDMEAAFADVLLSYESGKAYQKNFEHNENVLTTRFTELKNVLKSVNEKYEEIESKHEEMAEIIKRDAEAQMKKLENENFKLRASLKMADFKVHKLENEIDHITIESNNLQKMCDEMIQ